MKIVVVLGSQGGTQMCLDDRRWHGVLARSSVGSWSRRSISRHQTTDQDHSV